MKRLLLAVILGGLPLTLGQSADEIREKTAAAKERIAMLSKQFDELLVLTPKEKELIAACGVNCTRQVQEELRTNAIGRTTAVDNVISHIHSEVDAYLFSIVDPKQQIDLERKQAEQGLNQILPKVDATPSVFALDSDKDSSLILAYLLHKGTLMGSGSTSVMLRAYRMTDSGVALSDFAGSDLDGYGRVSVKELHSPIPDEAWLLVWGYMTGANGPNVRMRVYAYNGTKFRTMWMPENAWATFTIEVTDDGFTIDGDYYRQNKERHDRYFLSPDGLYLMFSGK
jgi:hypothetical protein